LVVVNYPVYVFTLDYNNQSSMLITAPDIPSDDLKTLRKKLADTALDLIVVNYHIHFTQFSN
jgi:hypothetical protein